MELLELFDAFDAFIRSIPGEPAPAELFMIRIVDEGFAIRHLWSGVARELPETVAPEPGVAGLLLASRGWAAPLEGLPASQHPERRRVRLLTLVCGPGAVLTRMHADGDEPQLLPDGEGDVPERLRRCWSRRPDALSYTPGTPQV